MMYFPSWITDLLETIYSSFIDCIRLSPEFYSVYNIVSDYL